ncbi:MAG TPA: glycosyltransferase family 9 protein [Acetobacteraceae bacterium]|nr:glycosyltransferase family 9 protein [Acetobacteraceae bacterium]
MRALFITATRIGDAVLSTGLLDHLLCTHPGIRITIACGPAAAGVFQRMPGLDRILVVDKRRYDLHWLELWATAVRHVWDLAIDLRGSALTLLLPARRRFIMRGGRRPGHRLIHLAGTLGLDQPPLPVAWTDAEDRALAETLLPEGGPVIGLGPTANWDGKIWPPDRFVALFRELAAGLPGARAAVFAGPGAAERRLCAPVLAALPEAIDLSGRLSLPQASACLARCALFVGNDSGLMHLAAAAGAPTLGLFGPTPAAEYAPAGRRTAAVEAPGPPGAAPMTALPVELVRAAATRLLGSGLTAAA